MTDDAGIFNVTDDRGVTPRLCELLWHDGVLGEHVPLVSMSADGVDELIAKLTAWRDAPRLAAREKPEVVAAHGGHDLLRTSAGDWGVRGVDGAGAYESPDWYATEDAARGHFRDATGASRCELCGTYRDDHDVDDDGIYTCTDERKAACESACAKKGPTP